VALAGDNSVELRHVMPLQWFFHPSRAVTIDSSADSERPAGHHDPMIRGVGRLVDIMIGRAQGFTGKIGLGILPPQP
jgi:hypothetical protein